VLARDAAMNGRFLFGVLTTGVYCRPSCAARRPLRKNVRFYSTAEPPSATACAPASAAGRTTRRRPNACRRSAASFARAPIRASR
jgi:AraC family transcriptional regulator of adaptative response/methylated-DNA-[protein]-cysteine methyltransferase